MHPGHAPRVPWLIRPWTDASAVSDLGLHCLPMSQKWDARHIWVKQRCALFAAISVFRTYFILQADSILLLLQLPVQNKENDTINIVLFKFTQYLHEYVHARDREREGERDRQTEKDYIHKKN